jgi:hypothetical protein
MVADPRFLVEVPVGDYARLGDGSWVRIAACLANQPFVRPHPEPAVTPVRNGPRPMPGHTPVAAYRTASCPPEGTS